MSNLIHSHPKSKSILLIELEAKSRACVQKGYISQGAYYTRRANALRHEILSAAKRASQLLFT